MSDRSEPPGPHWLADDEEDEGELADEGQHVLPVGVPEDAILRVFKVPREALGMRVDVFLQSQLRNTSRTRARRIVERTAYSPDGRRLKPSDRIVNQESIFLYRPALEEDEPPETIPTIYEDEHLLVIDKPPLMAVHPTARHHKSTVLKWLEAQRPNQFFSLIHRIDRETSGLLLIAKTPESDRLFKRQLEDRSIQAARTVDTSELDADEVFQKTYLAITQGVPLVSFIDLPVEVDPLNSLRVKMRVSQGGQPARTGVTVLETRSGFSLVSCRLFTGRQHQIRLHLSHIGCPIVGDKLYGADERLLARAADKELTEQDKLLLRVPRHALHAARYRLRHAVSAQTLELEAPLAADLAEFWASLSG